MNGWQLSFSERFDYSRFNDIVLPVKLSSDKANQILLRAKVDTGSTVLRLSAAPCRFAQHRYGNGNAAKDQNSDGVVHGVRARGHDNGRNQIVSVCQYPGRWICVEFYDFNEGVTRKGWVYKKYLKRVDRSPR